MTTPADEHQPADEEVLHIAGRVRVHWYGAKPDSPNPAVFAETVVTDADSGEVLSAATGVTIRCRPELQDGLVLVELTEPLDTDGRPLRRGRQWSGTEETVTSTYLLATDDWPDRTLDFGEALFELRAGQRVARRGWNGAGQWLVLVPGSSIKIEATRPLGQAAPELVGTAVDYAPHIDIRTAQGQIVPWLASQTDMLARDWFVVRDENGQA